MFTKRVPTSSTLLTLVPAGAVLAQPREWTDDFTTVATYDSASILAPCYGGPATKYTVLNAINGNIFNLRTWSGGEKLIVTDNDLDLSSCGDGLCLDLSFRPLNLTVLGWLGLGIGCPGEPTTLLSSHPFTSPNVCIYGGVDFSHWQIRSNTNVPDEPFGVDGLPGKPGVDDDNDGTTDEADESHNLRPTAANGGYGNINGTGFEAGQDNAPGDAGVDDDGNGTVDDWGETGWPGTDDGDDRPGANAWMVWLRLNLDVSTGVHLEMNPTRVSGGAFNIVEHPLGEAFLGETISLAQGNEIGEGFYNAETHYNYVFCTSGTCYGAQLWIERDMSNPAETLGPVINTFHTNPGPIANAVALGNGVTRLRLPGGEGQPDPPWPIRNTYTRQNVWRVNPNFTHKFWVVSGDTHLADFANNAFGYPSPSADLQNDRDVDGTDFLTFSNCFNGALNPPSIGPGCTAINARDADLDGDGDVDGTDFLTFSNCFNGDLKRPLPPCFPPDLTNCQPGGSSAMSGGGGQLAQSASEPDPFIFDGMTPTEDVWYLYTPGCTGQATLALCDSTGQGRSVDGMSFAFFDGTAEEATIVPATACGEGGQEMVPVVAGQTVYLLVFREPGAEALDGFTLDVTCGQ